MPALISAPRWTPSGGWAHGRGTSGPVHELRATGLAARAADLELREHCGVLDSPLAPLDYEIVRLAAAGLTNKQIGERLYISHRTVAAHLYQIFPRLGITSRAALRDAARCAGGTGSW